MILHHSLKYKVSYQSHVPRKSAGGNYLPFRHLGAIRGTNTFFPGNCQRSHTTPLIMIHDGIWIWTNPLGLRRGYPSAGQFSRLGGSRNGPPRRSSGSWCSFFLLLFPAMLKVITCPCSAICLVYVKNRYRNEYGGKPQHRSELEQGEEYNPRGF